MKRQIIGILLFSIITAVMLSGCGDNSRWKDAYIQFIKTEIDDKDANSNEIKYSLVKIDEDDTPELLYSGEGYVNTHLCWLKDGEVKHQFVCNQEFLYYEKKNSFYGFYFNHGVSHDLVYALKDGNLEKLFEGTGNFTKKDFEYSIDKKVISKSTYDKEVGKYFDKKNAATVNYCNGKNKIIKMIENY